MNLPSNREIGFDTWVEVATDDAILADEKLATQHVIYDPEGVPHLRLAPDGRCLALDGTVGDHVSCTIYASRPTPCRFVQPGDDLCHRYRQEHGL